MAPHMHPDDPSRMAVPYPYMPMNSNGVMAGHMFNWGGGGAGGNSAFQVRWRRWAFNAIVMTCIGPPGRA